MNALLRPMLIDGEWIATDALMEVKDPQDDRVLALVPEAGPAEARRAVAAAASAAGSARVMPAYSRAEALRGAAERVGAEGEAFARTIAEEGIKTIREARTEVARCAITLRLAAQEAERLGGETLRFDGFSGGEHRLGYWTRDPVGVVVAITPFNDPLNLVAHKVGPALAAGNAVIVKPHEETPLSALRLASVLVGSGLPTGLLQVITGRGDVVGDALVRDPGVHMVSFTGGRIVGDRVARAAGAKKLTMELGGNAAAIVLDDADLDVAVSAITAGAFSAAGQNCLHVQRVLIHRAIYPELRDRLTRAAQAIGLGDKLLESTDMGPMINKVAADRVSALIRDACANGARLVTGGVRHGAAIAPTLIEEVPRAHPLSRTEVFGPVTVLRPVASLAEAIDHANSGDVGLQAAIFTSSINAAFEAVQSLKTGGVIVNDSTDYRIDAMPFGGGNGSGIGREGVRHATESMSEPKVVCVTLPSGA